jgi:hypothetical protein
MSRDENLCLMSRDENPESARAVSHDVERIVAACIEAFLAKPSNPRQDLS